MIETVRENNNKNETIPSEKCKNYDELCLYMLAFHLKFMGCLMGESEKSKKLS